MSNRCVLDSAAVTNDEAAADYAAKLGVKDGAILHRLVNESWYLHRFWGEYLALFGGSASRIDLLNDASGPFFRLLQDELFDSVLLSLCRLTDPVSSQGNDARANVTISALPAMCKRHGRTEEEAEALEGQIATARNKASFAVDWRNRHIGHRSLDLVLGRGPELQKATRQKVREAIIAIHAVISRAHILLQGSSLFADFSPAVGGAEELLMLLRDGVKARDARRERIGNGTWTPEDMRNDSP